MKITQKEIKEVRNALKRNWHDKEWHNLIGSKKGRAIQYALSFREPYDTLKDIQTRANEHLKEESNENI